MGKNTRDTGLVRVFLLCAAILICISAPVLSGKKGGTAATLDAPGGEQPRQTGGQGEPSATENPPAAMPGGADGELSGPESERKDLADRIARLEEERIRIGESLLELRKEAGGNLENAEAAVVGLYKYKQMRYFAFLLSIGSLDQAVMSSHRAKRFLEDDYRVLADLRTRVLNINTLEALLVQKEHDLSEMKLEMAVCEGVSDPTRTKASNGTASSPGQHAAAASPGEETRKGVEQRASTRKPILVFGEVSFPSRRGALPLPTPGEIVVTYGTRPNAKSRGILHNSGILISARAGRPVQAIHEGLVMFADVLKEYGKVVIINHGDHYYSLIAHAGELTRKAGESVKAGETVAMVGDGASGRGPKLYFEIRHHGKPIDPRGWLAVQKSSKE